MHFIASRGSPWEFSCKNQPCRPGEGDFFYFHVVPIYFCDCRKRSRFCGNIGKKYTDVNNVNGDNVNTENSLNNDCGDQNNLSTHTTASDKNVEPIEVSTPNCSDYITGNRIIDIEILSSIVNMLAIHNVRTHKGGLAKSVSLLFKGGVELSPSLEFLSKNFYQT